jgi:DNA (cytosine-5)-methyltransferase 1
MTAAWFSEIEPFPCSVLKHHWPDVPNLGDMTMLPTAIRMGLIEAPEVLVGGTPCQAFSVAGQRGSLDDDRGQLTLTYVDLLNAIDEQRDEPAICVWENVPGVLSTKDNAFGCFLGELSGSGCELQPSGKRWTNAGCVFGPQRAVAWRVIDAQYFGLAQRRKRVFVVASAREGFDPTKVLFESEGVRRDGIPARETPVSVCLTARGAGSLDDRETYIVDKDGRPSHLMPLENERQQGFPDGHTDVPHRGKPACDGPRYKAIGNSKAVPCIQWVGIRLMLHVAGIL